MTSVGPRARLEHPVEAVIFDAGLTLLRAVPSFWGAFTQGLERAGADVPVIEDVVVDTPVAEVWAEHERAWSAAGHPSPYVGDGLAERRYWLTLYRAYLQHLEVDGDHDEIVDHIHDAFAAPGVFRPFDDVADHLASLRDHGMAVALLSNWGTSLRDILIHERLLDAFDVVGISGELGLSKPDPRAFHAVLERLGVGPGPGIVYVGDSLTDDVAPSRALGLTPVLMDRWDRHVGHDGPRVRNLAELFEMVAGPSPT